MAIRTTRFPEHELNLYVVSGTHTGEDAIRFFQSLDASDSTRWLTYFDPRVDMSGVDVASLPKLKRCIAEKQRELFGETPAPRVLVCSSSAQEDFFSRFWSGYVLKGDLHPVKPPIVCNLEAAYDGLGLSDAARAAVARAISDSDATASGPSQTSSRADVAPTSIR